MSSKKDMRQFELSKLKNTVGDEVIKDRTLSQGFKPLKNVTEHINTNEIQNVVRPDDVAQKIAHFRALKAAGKKIAGIIPFAGAGYAALQGDPAMAADELAEDVPVAGQIYSAIKPESAGSADDDRQMQAESQAYKNYGASDAHADRMARLAALAQMRK